MITIHQRHRQTDRRTDGQTDRQTTCDRNTALCTKVHRAVKMTTENQLISFEAASDFNVVQRPAVSLTNGEFTLMHVSKPKESILKTCYHVLFHNCQ